VITSAFESEPRDAALRATGAADVRGHAADHAIEARSRG
jgi:hypothetical protein